MEPTVVLPRPISLPHLFGEEEFKTSLPLDDGDDSLINKKQHDVPQQNEITAPSLDDIPLEISAFIFSLLSLEDRAVASRVSKRWHWYCWQCQFMIDIPIFKRRALVSRHLSVLQHCWQLRDVNLSCARQITDDSLQFIAGLQHIKRLNLSFCKNLSTKGIAVIANNLNNIKSLNLSYCDGVDDRAVEQLLHLHELLELDVSNCYRISDSSAPPMASMKQLKYLDVRYDNLTRLAITRLSHIPCLKHTCKESIMGCSKRQK